MTNCSLTLRILLLTAILVAIPMAGWAQAQRRAVMEDLLWDSRPSYTRFIVNFTSAAGEVVWRQHEFPSDPRVFYIDFYDLRPTYSDQQIPIGDGLLRMVQIQNFFDNNVIRFIFYLQDPAMLNRVSISEEGYSLQIDLMRRSAPRIQPPQPTESIQQRWGGRPVIIIDPGHGGVDSGTISPRRINGNAILEKDVNLLIARQVTRRLQATGQFDVYMTRTEDVHMTLEERVDFAREHGGSMFVSIHANDAGNPQRYDVARGMELYYLDNRGLLGELQQAVREQTGHLDREELITLVRDQANNLRMESYTICNSLRMAFQRHRYWRDAARGGDDHFRFIRMRNFHVLRNFDMPCVLIEAGYLTNMEEARLLIDPDFQSVIVDNIVNGLVTYYEGREAQRGAG